MITMFESITKLVNLTLVNINILSEAHQQFLASEISWTNVLVDGS